MNTSEDILIVEDSPTQAEQLRYLLEEHNYRVEVARNGREALDLIRQHKPTMVVSDIVMPEMDGYELCRQIRMDGDAKDLPVILLTVLSDPKDIIRALQAGADNFIVKPYDESYLLSRIHHVLVNRELHQEQKSRLEVEVDFAGQRYLITAKRPQMLGLLLSTYETAIRQNQELLRVHEELRAINEQLEEKVVERTVTLTTEIAERKRAEEALAQAVQQWQETFDAIEDMVAILDTDYRVVLANRAMKQAFVSTPVVGAHCYELFHGTESPLPTCLSCQVFRTGEAVHFEFCEQHLGGRWFDLSAYPIKDSKGVVRQLVHIARDITEHKRLEAQFLQAQKMEVIGRLSGGVAHDFNNLLTIILGSVGIAGMELPPKHPVGDMLNDIKQAAQRAANLTRQLLAFARRQVIQPQILDLNDLVINLTKMLRRLIGEDIELMMLPSSLPVLVNIDPGQLEQVLVNLVINARDAMPHGGKLTVAITQMVLDEAYAEQHVEFTPGKYMLLSISDTGTGMTEEVRVRCFEPFFTTKEVGKETGLGLAMVYGIVVQSGGHIEVESAVGQGTTFTIYLPLVEEGARMVQHGETEELPR